MSNPDLTRRSWLKAAAVAGGASMLAGCGGGGSENIDAEVPDEDVDKTFVTTEFNTIHNNNFNPYDVLYIPNQSIYYLFNDLFFSSQVTDEDMDKPGLGESYERDGDVAVIELDDRFTWHDGKPVTADDVLVRWTLDLLMERRNWEMAFADCYAEDDHTVVLELQEDANDDLVKDFVSNTLVCTHPDTYEEFLPEDGSRGAGAYDDLASFEYATLRGDLLSFTVRQPMGSDHPEEEPLIGNGPWKMADIGDRTMTFERYEDHPFYDEINFPNVRFDEYTTNQARYQALLSDEVSGMDLLLTQTVWDQLPDYYDKYIFKRRLGVGLAFNYERFPDHRVRQALAFAMDKPQIVANSGLADPIVDVHEFDTGLYDDEERHAEVFGDDFIDLVTQYEQDTDRAAELLEEVGWSRDDGQWYDENDERVEITIKVPPTWSEWVNMIQTATQHLNDFGIDAEFQTEELVVYYGQTMIQVDYDMAAWWCGGARDFPWFAYNTAWNSIQTVADDNNHPDTYEEVPGPIGEHNGDDTFEINVQEALKDIATTRTGTDEIRELNRRLGWTYNQMLPVYCLHVESGLATLDTRNWAAPGTDSESGNVFFPLSYMNNRGEIKATDF